MWARGDGVCRVGVVEVVHLGALFVGNLKHNKTNLKFKKRRGGEGRRRRREGKYLVVINKNLGFLKLCLIITHRHIKNIVFLKSTL